MREVPQALVHYRRPNAHYLDLWWRNEADKVCQVVEGVDVDSRVEELVDLSVETAWQGPEDHGTDECPDRASALAHAT